MTKGETAAYNSGIEAVLDIARRSAAILRAAPWRPAREGGADALDELAHAGEALLLPDPDAPPPAIGVRPTPGPRSPNAGAGAYGGARSAGADGNFGVSDAEIASPSRQTLIDWLSGRTPMLASHWSRRAAAMLSGDLGAGRLIPGKVS